MLGISARLGSVAEERSTWTCFLTHNAQGTLMKGGQRECKSQATGRALWNAAFWAWPGFAQSSPQLRLPAQDLHKNQPDKVPARLGERLLRPTPSWWAIGNWWPPVGGESVFFWGVLTAGRLCPVGPTLMHIWAALISKRFLSNKGRILNCSVLLEFPL